MRMTADISRAEKVALYMLENDKTIRAAAFRFGISKSTVHKDLQNKLKRENPILYTEIEKLLRKNQSERHLRGGFATREKYRSLAVMRDSQPKIKIDK